MVSSKDLGNVTRTELVQKFGKFYFPWNFFYLRRRLCNWKHAGVVVDFSYFLSFPLDWQDLWGRALSVTGGGVGFSCKCNLPREPRRGPETCPLGTYDNKMAANYSKCSILTILQKNRGLWTVENTFLSVLMFLKMALLVRAEFFIIVESTFSPSRISILTR